MNKVVEWAAVSTIERSNPLLESVKVSLSLTGEQIDALFN